MANEAQSAQATNSAFDLHKRRSGKAWTERQLWQKLYDDAYEFAIPFRRPASRLGKAQSTVERIFDNTAIVSSFRSAGQLKEDLFPSGQESFRLAPGPIAKKAFKEADVTELARQLEDITQIVSAFFMVPEFDAATNEMCIDLLVGTAAILPLEGDRDRPVRFVCIPFDEVAIEVDAFGAVTLVSWKTKLTLRQINKAFPKGVYPDDFKETLKTAPETERDIWQDFYVDDNGQWKFIAYVESSEKPIWTESYRTQPLAVPRYYRVPGEAYGRGPILLTLPTIKTLNKAMELMLKAAAIQMLGIWGWRPGSAFNPDTARVAPGQFWPMGATGGALGPDVARLDTAGGKMDVGQLVTQELRVQVQAGLHDENLPVEGGTPRSATEIIERMKRTAQNYLGAFGRLVNEIHPVLVRRVIEILYDAGMLETEINIDTLLVKIDVLSPLAASLRSQALTTIIEFIELVSVVKGEEGLELLVKVDDALRHVGLERGVPPQLITTETEQRALERRIEKAAAQMVAARQQQDAAPAEAAA